MSDFPSHSVRAKKKLTDTMVHEASQFLTRPSTSDVRHPTHPHNSAKMQRRGWTHRIMERNRVTREMETEHVSPLGTFDESQQGTDEDGRHRLHSIINQTRRCVAVRVRPLEETPIQHSAKQIGAEI